MPFRLLVLAFVLLTTSLGAPASAEQGGYLVTVVGRVVSVDRRGARIVLHHAMLETTPAGNELCLVPRRLLRYLRAGMDVTATADTRRHPWRLVQLQHFHADDRLRPEPRIADRRVVSRRD